MPSILSTQENALTFAFRGTNRLYTDHEGRRVIADIEGVGRLRVLHADPPLTILRASDESVLFGETFDNGAIVLANEPGEVIVTVQSGRLDPLAGEPVQVEGPYSGAGWVVSAKNSFSVDDRCELAALPAHGLVVPFFRSIDSEGVFTVIESSSQVAEQIDSFSIDSDMDLKRRGFRVQNISKVTSLESSFANGHVLRANVACHLNAASFSLSIPPENDGLILRKTYDAFHGRQRARVHVNGRMAGWWYLPAEDRVHRWHKSDFGISAELTQGQYEVQLTIDPPAGVALWSVSKMEIFSLLKRRSDSSATNA